MTATNQPTTDGAPAGANQVRHKPDCRRAGPFRTRPGDSGRIIIICRRCGARAAVPDAGPARPGRATAPLTDAEPADGPAAVVADRPVIIRSRPAIRYFCAVHPDVVVSWRGTDCPDCQADRAERLWAANNQEEFPR